ncbi:MAG: CHASE2 domain-containing protein [Bryobacterales bacterium]|nr:CHASE2 domain-containing protein [Bryobacterales bacterium]
MKPGGRVAGYAGVLVLSFAVAVVSSYTPLGRQIDNDAYDWMFRLRKPSPWTPQSVILGIDEASFQALGGVRGLRGILSDVLERLAPLSPKVVAVDLTLSDAGEPAEDARLEAAMGRTGNLVLAAELMPGGTAWQDPLERFRQHASAVGHVHAAQDPLDGVNRQVPLEKAAGRERHWALSLEAYRLSRGAARIVESPEELRVNDLIIPARREDARAIYVRRLPSGPHGGTAIPRISAVELRDDPAAAESLRGKVVLIGVTAQSAARDRLMTPYSSEQPMPGVEIHANAFETLAQNRFVKAAGDTEVLLACGGATVLAGLVFWLLSGWAAYGTALGLLAAATALPYALFSRDTVFPPLALVASAWLSAAGAASYQHFTARRQLRRAEAEKTRYQQAVHFVTHEMRTPLTAIQGSSELMSRYNLNDEKRKQIADLIHSESRRLGRMIETFLNVERLSAGQMEMRREQVPLSEVVQVCLDRAQALADRKQITVERTVLEDATLAGDRELLEYAFYNLLTNAIKYSPSGARVTVAGRQASAGFRLSVRDEGIGMDRKEVESVFRRFYRTRRAIASGEAGSGIGLSIVEQIVSHHGGRIEVESAPGKGSCFTLVLPVPGDGAAG